MINLNILITGVTSFTGAHFAYELLRSGQNVKGFSRRLDTWDSEQSNRIAWISHQFPEFEMIDGSGVGKLKPNSFDLICLHGASAQNYKSREFDVEKALLETFEVTNPLLKAFPNSSILHTGTFSEPNESAGEFPRVSFNPYSTSKALIWDKLEVEHREKRRLAKYIMPNPFGPLESKRLIDYLIKSWSLNQVPIIRNPFYVRDNVPIDLLRMHYAESVLKLFGQNQSITRFYPSMYAETLSTFVKRYIREFNIRFDKFLPVKMTLASEYTEPIIRVNTENCQIQIENWDETKSWDSTIEDALIRMAKYEKE